MNLKSVLDKFEIPQNWQNYSPEEHQIWCDLYDAQFPNMEKYACDEFFNGIEALDLHSNGIPNFELLNEKLFALTGWKIIAVEGLIPDYEFFLLLANRIFPAGHFIRSREQFEYISEPDIFHDVFGHVPLLTNPIFADYMAAYGEGGLRATEFDTLKELARLYWYTVEFGLIKTQNGIKVYGAGILSSPKETVFSIESAKPHRIKFDLLRLMQTDYRIYDLQDTYFVIEDFKELFDATLQDFAPIYKKVKSLPMIDPLDTINSDTIIV